MKIVEFERWVYSISLKVLIFGCVSKASLIGLRSSNFVSYVIINGSGDGWCCWC